MQRLALTPAVLVVFLISGCCCMGIPGGSASAPAPAPSPPTAASTRDEALTELRSHLSSGTSYGDGPGAQGIANNIRSRVNDYADGAAVKVMPGNPTRVVALVICTDLADVETLDRRGLVQLVTMSVAQDLPDADIGVAIQGQFIFGAAGVKRRSDDGPRTWVGSTVNVADVTALFSADIAGPDVQPPTPVPPPVVPAAPNADLVTALNEVCGDTFCEGEYDYTFKTLTCDGATCTLAFEAREAESAPATASVSIPSARLRDTEGDPSEQFFSTVGSALSRWARAQARRR